MANEFIIKNGFHSKGDSQVTGSLNVSSTLTVNGSAVGAAFPFSGDAQITGSLTVSGSDTITNNITSSGFMLITSSNTGGSANSAMTPGLVINQVGSSQNHSGPAIRLVNSTNGEETNIYHQPGGSGAIHGNGLNILTDGGINIECGDDLGSGNKFFSIVKGQAGFTIDDDSSAPRTDVKIHNGNGGTAYSRLSLGASSEYWYIEADDNNTPFNIGFDDGSSDTDVITFTKHNGSLTGSFAIIGGPLRVTGSLISSGSVVDFTGATAISGSTFSGSFSGDGSQLTNLSTSSTFPFTGDAQITGSLTVSGSFNAFRMDTKNVILGEGAASSLTFGGAYTEETVIIGYNAATNLTNSDFNTVIGSQAGVGLVAHQQCTFLGYKAGFGTAQSKNTAIGTEAGYGATGKNNAYLGYRAGYANGSSGAQAENISIGAESLYKISSGIGNVVGGYRAGYNISSGGGNIALGNYAGYNQTTGNGNITIGSGSLGVAGESNQLRIGHSDLTVISGSLETGEVEGRWQRPIFTHTTDFSISGSEYIGGYNIVGGNVTCSIATGSMNPGAEFEFFQTSSAGNMLFVTASAAMNVIVKNDNLNLAGQGSGASLKYITGTTFHLVGDLT